MDEDVEVVVVCERVVDWMLIVSERKGWNGGGKWVLSIWRVSLDHKTRSLDQQSRKRAVVHAQKARANVSAVSPFALLHYGTFSDFPAAIAFPALHSLSALSDLASLLLI